MRSERELFMIIFSSDFSVFCFWFFIVGKLCYDHFREIIFAIFDFSVIKKLFCEISGFFHFLLFFVFCCCLFGSLGNTCGRDAPMILRVIICRLYRLYESLLLPEPFLMFDECTMFVIIFWRVVGG